MERMPGAGAEWTKRRERDKVFFEVIQINPTTGVTTIWEKHTRPFLPLETRGLHLFVERRTDKLPSSNLHREIVSYSIPKGTDYTIIEDVEEFGKYAGLGQDEVFLSLYHHGTHYGLTAEYERSELKSIEVSPDMFSHLYTFVIGFNLDNVSPINVAIYDLREEALREEADIELDLRGICFGEQFRYEDFAFQVNDELEYITVILDDLSGENPRMAISVPKKVDKEEFRKRIMTPESIGWEKALEVADIKFSKLE